MRRRKSPGDRLISIIARYRGAATVRQIARAHLTGQDLEQAKRETDGLVVFEPTFRNGRRKRSKTARLTLQGIWQAIRLTTGYDAGLVLAVLAATDIKAYLDRLEAEGNPLAVELRGYKEDALEFRRQLAARKEAKTRKEKEALAHPRRKRNARHYERLNQFLGSRGKKPAKLPPTTTVKSIPSSPWGSAFTPPSPPTPANAPHVRPLPVPATLIMPTADKRLEEAAEARKEELRRHCVVCSGGASDVPHDCSRFQAAWRAK